MSYPVRTLQLMDIEEGHAGIEQTVEVMRQLADQGAEDPLLVETAGRIVSGAGSSEVAALWIRDYLASYTRFVPDPPELQELIRTPASMLREIEDRGVSWGDCDDVATLGAALGKAVGIPARFTLLGFTPAGPYEHVFSELLTDGGPVELDTTRPAQLPESLRVWRTGHREA